MGRPVVLQAGAGWGGASDAPLCPRSSAPVVAQTLLAPSTAPCSPETLWASCAATWSPRRWRCGSPWGRPGHDPGRVVAWGAHQDGSLGGRAGGPGWGQLWWVAQLTPGPPTPAPSGLGSRRCPPTCPSSRAAGSHHWTCCRRPPGRWRGWRQPPLMRSERPQPRLHSTPAHCPHHPALLAQPLLHTKSQCPLPHSQLQ